MPSPQPFKMELLDEQPDSPPSSAPAPPSPPSAREAQLQAAEQRILSTAALQQKTALYIQTLLQMLGLRSLLLLALASATALTFQILTNPEASLQKMILVGAVDALLVLPMIWLIAKKG